MPLVTATISGTFTDPLLAGRTFSAYVEPNTTNGLMTYTGQVIAGRARIDFTSGTATVSLPTTNQTGIGPTGVRWRLVIPGVVLGHTDPVVSVFTLTANTTWDVIANAVAVPYTPTAADTSDAAIASAVNNPASTTAGALKPFIESDVGAVNVRTKGAVGDGVTDDTAAIQSAITAASALGADVYLPGKCKITSTLTVTSPNVMVRGDGGDSSHDVGASMANAATRLVWAGAAGGTMVSFASPTAAGAQTCTGGGVKGVAFDSGSTAAVGLSVTSWRDGLFQDLFFSEFATTDILVTCSAGGGEARDSQRNRFINVRFRQVVSAGCFFTLDGIVTANASFNYFQDCAGTYVGSATVGAYNLRNCDNNVFVQCSAYRATATGTSVVCHAGPALTSCRDNVFLHFSTNGPITCKGTEEAAEASNNNSFHYLDTGNATPTPTLGTGATAQWSFTNGLYERAMFSGVNVGDSPSAAAVARNLGGLLKVVDGGESHAHFSTPSQAARWSLAVLNTGGHFRIAPLAGTGQIILNADAAIAGKSGFNNTTPITKPTVTGSRGGNAALASLLTALANYGLITDSSTV